MKRTLKRILILSFVVALALLSFRFIFRRNRDGRVAPVEPWTPPQSVHVEVHPPESPPAAPEPSHEPATAPPVQPEVTSAASDESPAPPVARAPDPVPAPAESVPNKTPWFAPDPVPAPLPGPEAEWAPEPSPDAEWDPEHPGDALVTDAPPPAQPPGESPPPTITGTPLSRLRVVEPEEVKFTRVEPTPIEPEPAAIPAADEPDALTTYFDRLAETPDSELLGHLAASADLPAEEPAAMLPPTTPADTSLHAEAGPPSVPDVDLPESLERALTDLAPVPIVPPPRRTAESYLDEGNVYFNVSQYGLAIERYTTAADMDPNLVAAYYNRANAWTRAGEFDAALADYDRALGLQPLDADALNNRGMLHLYRANYADAMRDFDAALAIDPGDATVMVNRGLAHLHSGDAAAALVDFQEAAVLDGSDAAAAYGAAQAAAVLGNRDEALRHVARALELNPGYAREAAADPNLAVLQGDAAFLKLLRENGPRQP